MIKDDAQLAKTLRIDDWVRAAGLPPNCPEIVAAELVGVNAAAQSFLETGRTDRIGENSWTTHHWLHFLRALPQPLSLQQMKVLDQHFQLSQSGNSEILHDWLLLSIRSRYQPAMPALEEFLTTQGRRKFLIPLYGAMRKTSDGMLRAQRIYRKARPTYHPVTMATIDELLQWPSK